MENHKETGRNGYPQKISTYGGPRKNSEKLVLKTLTNGETPFGGLEIALKKGKSLDINPSNDVILLVEQGLGILTGEGYSCILEKGDCLSVSPNQYLLKNLEFCFRFYLFTSKECANEIIEKIESTNAF
jgi:hypothetical protein